MEKICAKCEALFTCDSAQANCWCGTVKLSTYSLHYLETNFSGCICPACLRPFDLAAPAEMDADENEESNYD